MRGNSVSVLPSVHILCLHGQGEYEEGWERPATTYAEPGIQAGTRRIRPGGKNRKLYRFKKKNPEWLADGEPGLLSRGVCAGSGHAAWVAKAWIP